MHQDLERAFEKMIELVKADTRCLGGWHYGSISRKAEDIYSDYDPVFLVKDENFNSFDQDIQTYLAGAADELLLFWGEDFNDNYFKNYCSIIRIGTNLHQLDFFVINMDYPDVWMCKQHCKGCTPEHIIFDRSGEVKTFLEKGYRTDNNLPDTVRAMDTYWFHLEMLIKYFKRRDIFKLIKNIEVLFHAHVDLLLSYYDNLDWGAWESKVKYCVPKEKQQHLLHYYMGTGIMEMQSAIISTMDLFYVDAMEICKKKNISYNEQIPVQVMTYFRRRMDEEN